MEGRAVAYEPLASNFDWLKIRDELEDMGDSMNCDVDFDDETGEQVDEIMSAWGDMMNGEYGGGILEW